MNKNSDYYVKKGNLNYKERSLLDALKKQLKNDLNYLTMLYRQMISMN
jgi:hypothetical protein